MFSLYCNLACIQQKSGIIRLSSREMAEEFFMAFGNKSYFVDLTDRAKGIYIYIYIYMRVYVCVHLLTPIRGEQLFT